MNNRLIHNMKFMFAQSPRGTIGFIVSIVATIIMYIAIKTEFPLWTISLIGGIASFYICHTSITNEDKQLTNLVKEVLSKHDNNGIASRIREVKARTNTIIATGLGLGLMVIFVSISIPISKFISDNEQKLMAMQLPPYIKVEGRTTYLVFEKMSGDIAWISFPSEALEVSILDGNYARSNFPDVLYEIDSKSKFRSINCERYVDESPFSKIIPELYSQYNSDDTFIKEIWNIVTQLNTYTPEMQNTPRYPLETLLMGGGDCEDSSILFASMLKAAPTDWDIQVILVDTEDLLTPTSINHAMVYLDTGTNSYVIETTSRGDMCPYDSVAGWGYNKQLNTFVSSMN